MDSPKACFRLAKSCNSISTLQQIHLGVTARMNSENQLYLHDEKVVNLFKCCKILPLKHAPLPLSYRVWLHLSIVLIALICHFSSFGDWWLVFIALLRSIICSPWWRCLGWEMTVPLGAVSSGDVVPLSPQTYLFLVSDYCCSGCKYSREERRLWKLKMCC